MKIVVLDGYTLNPGDLSWENLESLGECTVYERTSPDEILPRSKDADILLTNKTPLSSEIIENCRRLQYIGVMATGFNLVDTGAAAVLKIPVTNIPSYGTVSVAQMAMAHLLNLAQRIAHHDRTVKNGRWSESSDFCYWDIPPLELRDKTLGIVGLGRIGKALAGMALAFEMRILASDVANPENIPGGCRMTDTDTLLETSDVISLHCPLTDKNRHMINARSLSIMKTSAFLINTSRGGLIDEQALADALNTGQIAGAGLDVLDREPPAPDNPLFSARNCYITPHIAWATRAARQRLMDTVVRNIRAFLDGEPENVVNTERRGDLFDIKRRFNREK